MSDKVINASRAALAAVVLVLAGGLSACGDQPRPQPAYQPPGEPAPRAEELAGSPADALPAPPTEAPAPADTAAPPPPPMQMAIAPPPPVPGDRDVIYDLGPVASERAPAPPPPHRTRPMRSVHGHPTRPHHRRPRPAAPSAPPAARTVAAKPAARTAVTTSAPKAQAPKAAAPKAAAPKAAVPLATPAAKPKHVSRHAPAKAEPDAQHAAKVAALKTALTDEVARKAVLSGADNPSVNKPAEVTLTLPADFAQTLRDEAAKAGLADAAASVNITAQLSGDGYAVTPDEAQSRPLTVGQPTEFHWTATPEMGAKGPLNAQVGAVLLGGGSEPVALGTVVKTDHKGFHVSPRAVGAALLALIAVLVLSWLARGRGNGDRRRRPMDYTRRDLGPTLEGRPYDPPRDDLDRR